MITSLRSCRCLSRRHLARISMSDMFGESSMNSGASATSLIRLASRPQSSSLICPVRMMCIGTRASADSNRIVISFRPISSENTTVGSPCRIVAERAKSRASAELWVGIMPRPARYSSPSLSTWTQRTGRGKTGRTSVMNRHRVSCGAPVGRSAEWLRATA